MKAHHTFAALAAIIFCISCSKGTAPSKAPEIESQLVFEENFDQPDHFDETVWRKETRGPSDWNKYMSSDAACYAMRNGKLVLRGIKNTHLPGDTAPYLTGGVCTQGKKSFEFGRIEINAKLNGAKGAWPAIWMMPEGNIGWPNGGEIDIMERLNFDGFVYQTIHTNYTYNLGFSTNPLHTRIAKINPAEFNTYAVEKYRDSLVFFVNDKKTFTYPRIKTEKEGQFPFDLYKFYLIIDMQLGGSWVGNIDPAHLPVEMEVDWVRFYEFKNY